MPRAGEFPAARAQAPPERAAFFAGAEPEEESAEASVMQAGSPRSSAESHPGAAAPAGTAMRFPIGCRLLMPWIGRGRRLECGLLILVATGLMGCDVASMPGLGPRIRGSGVAGTERRSVEPFDAVSVAGDFAVSIRVAPETSVSLTGDDNLLPIVRTEVRDGTLHIEATRLYSARRGIQVSLTTPALRAVSVSGSSNVAARRFRAGSFRASVSGSGNLLAEGDADSLDVSVSGSADVMLAGGADQVTAAVSGSGDLHLLELRARTADVSVSGSGSAALLATERLNASVSGSGEVRYAGTPRVTRRVTGSGTVEPMRPAESSRAGPRPRRA
jgi:Putative auto-transporter adhesin, head GIN domain